MHSKYTNQQEESAIQEYEHNGLYTTPYKSQDILHLQPYTDVWNIKKLEIQTVMTLPVCTKVVPAPRHTPAICPDIPVIRPQELSWMNFAVALNLGKI